MKHCTLTPGPLGRAHGTQLTSASARASPHSSRQLGNIWTLWFKSVIIKVAIIGRAKEPVYTLVDSWEIWVLKLSVDIGEKWNPISAPFFLEGSKKVCKPWDWVGCMVVKVTLMGQEASTRGRRQRGQRGVACNHQRSHLRLWVLQTDHLIHLQHWASFIIDNQTSGSKVKH